VLAAGCHKAVPPARLDAGAPPLAREAAAAARAEAAPPSPVNLIPGVYHLRAGDPATGAALLGLAAAETATGTALYLSRPADDRDFEDHPGLVVPFVAAQDVFVYSWTEAVLDRQRAAGLTHVPLDTPAELVAAPFNGAVLRRPVVWGGVLGMVGAGVAVTAALDGAAPRLSSAPVHLYGARLAPAVGHPLATANGVVLFEHVAIAEEVAFRGILQSGLVRGTRSELGGWAIGSAVFGGMHAVNTLLMPKDERADYLLHGVPFITLVGSYLGLVYHEADYALAPSVAAHFWYDLLIVALDVAADPERGLWSVGWSSAF
jgi:membrane protease YdiL (CAAX protease family)